MAKSRRLGRSERDFQLAQLQYWKSLVVDEQQLLADGNLIPVVYLAPFGDAAKADVRSACCHVSGAITGNNASPISSPLNVAAGRTMAGAHRRSRSRLGASMRTDGFNVLER